MTETTITRKCVAAPAYRRAARAPPSHTKGKHPARPKQGASHFETSKPSTYAMNQIPPQAVPNVTSSKIVEADGGKVTFDGDEFAVAFKYFPIRSLKIPDEFDWAAHAEAVAIAIFGEPNKNLCWRPPNNVCFGDDGSVCVNYKKGLWWNFETEQGGGVWDLICDYKGMEDHDEAVAYAKECRENFENRRKPRPRDGGRAGLEQIEQQEVVEKVEATTAEENSIAKPGEFSLDKFKAKRTATVANVETLQSPLPVHNMAAAKDFVRLHPDEENYWSAELCFVDVPVKGQKHNTLHLIDEDLALRFLEAGEIKRFRIALASKPNDVFFLCTIPTQNLDNSWNDTNLEACEKSKTLWTKAVSRKGEGAENYKITFAKDPQAFSDPKWPTQSLGELIARAFAGRMIEAEDHPALLRKIGAKQSLS